MENTPEGLLTSVEDVGKILDNVSNLGFLLDVGHANVVSSNTPYDYFECYHNLIRHLHLSDNTGTDQHLPIGLGNINWNNILKHVKHLKYCKTATLEVFARNGSKATQTAYQLLSYKQLNSFA